MAEETIITKLEKGRAEFAYNCVCKAINKFKNGSKDIKEYRSYVRKIPMMILSNGLGQTLAFVFSKKKNGNAYELIYNQLTEYLKSNATTRLKMPSNQQELVKWVISCQSGEYKYITDEILSFLKWLKKFADGMIEGENANE